KLPREGFGDKRPAVGESQGCSDRPGKGKRSKAQGRNARGLVAEVLRIAAMSGGSQRSGWGGSRRRGQSSFGKGRTAFARSRLFGSGRRVLVRSEEHTSELQSRENLVCRL